MALSGKLSRSSSLPGSLARKESLSGRLGLNPSAIPITVDNQLSLSSTNPVQNKVITAAITNRLWSDEVKDALLQIVEKVAYIDDQGQTYYDALYDALYPPVGLDSIGAVFDSSATIYNTDTLDDLKQYLTVTAFYSDGTSETVTTYTLSGSMDAGTQTITVSYGGKTTTFTVTVVENSLVSISAVFTQGSATIYDTDSLDTLKQYLVVTATYSNSTTAVVTDYTLSGTLTVGTSTITVSYGGKTDTFTVTVSVNTTAQIATEGKVLEHKSSGSIVLTTKTYGGVTVKYDMDEATTILYLTGIIPYQNTTIANAVGAIVAYDDNGTVVNYINEKTANTDNRWAQSSASPTEFTGTRYTLASPYTKIAFSVDIRYLDDAYMFDAETGQVFFAGVNTPYYGMRNISEAS